MGQIHLKIKKNLFEPYSMFVFPSPMGENWQPENNPFPSGIYFTAVEKTSHSANLFIFVFVLKIICLDEDEFLTHSVLRDKYHLPDVTH